MAEHAQAHALLEALSEGVLLVERGHVSYANRAARLFLDLNERRWLGAPLIAVLRDHRLERAYLEAVTTECETRGRILLARPVPGGLALLDVSEVRRSRESARELLAVLSHELRTPVATIRSTLEALRSAELSAPLRERFLQRAEAESERLVRLLEDLTVDVKPPRYRSIHLPEVIGRAVSLLQRTLEQHGVTLEQRIEVETVWADADKLLQVLINLLENAAIHGPDGKRVRLLASYEDREEMAAITVQDEGMPLPEATLEQLFEPHARGPSVKAKGTGLGLYVVRSIAERWGGLAWGRPLGCTEAAEHPEDSLTGNEFGVTVRLRPQG